MSDKTKLKNLFADLILGYSVIQDFFYKKDGATIYLKHFNQLDSALITNKKTVFYEKAVRDGADTKEARIAYLIKEKLWDVSKDKKLADDKYFLDGLKITKSNLWKENDLKQINKQIDDITAKIYEVEREKSELIGYTAETYPFQKINELFVINSLYTDVGCNNRLFDFDSFGNLDNDEVSNIVQIYNNKVEDFNEKNLRRVALLGDYFNLFSLCDDNPFYLYGKAILSLTHYQIQVFQYAKNFKFILSNSKNQAPADITEDPDKLEEWYTLSKNAEEILDSDSSKNAAATSLVGLTKGDMKKLGIEQSGGINIKDLAGKSMEEIIKAHGL